MTARAEEPSVITRLRTQCCLFSSQRVTATPPGEALKTTAQATQHGDRGFRHFTPLPQAPRGESAGASLVGCLRKFGRDFDFKSTGIEIVQGNPKGEVPLSEAFAEGWPAGADRRGRALPAGARIHIRDPVTLDSDVGAPCKKIVEAREEGKMSWGDTGSVTLGMIALRAALDWVWVVSCLTSVHCGGTPFLAAPHRLPGNAPTSSQVKYHLGQTLRFLESADLGRLGEVRQRTRKSSLTTALREAARLCVLFRCGPAHVSPGACEAACKVTSFMTCSGSSLERNAEPPDGPAEAHLGPGQGWLAPAARRGRGDDGPSAR